MKDYKAFKWEHIWRILFKAFFAFFFKSYELIGSLYNFKRSWGISFSAIAFAWSGVCPPICPKLHAAAALTDSFSLESDYLRGGIPLADITPMANVSSNAEI